MFRVVEDKNGSCILDKNTGRILCVIPKRSKASSPPPPATSNNKKSKQASQVVPETRSRINLNNNVNKNNHVNNNCDRNNNPSRVIKPSSSSSQSYSTSSSSSVSPTQTAGTSLLLSKCGLLLNGINGSNSPTLASLLLSPNTPNATDSVVQKNKHHQNQNERSHRNQQKHLADTISKVDLCSVLGQKMLLCVPEAKFKFDMADFYHKIEKNCSTDNRSVLNAVLIDVNRPRNGKSRMTRSNNVINGVVSASWGPRHYVHTYTFNKTQRLERWATLESGLNWKGRIKAFCCRPFKIVAPRMLTCPLCKTHLGRTKNHNCSDYRNSPRRISPSSSKCIDNQMNLDPSVIYADLKDNEEFILSLTSRKRSRYSARLKGSLHLNSNQTKVTRNGNCKVDVAINNKSTDDVRKISNSINNSYHNVHNNVENTDHKNHPTLIYESPSDYPSTSTSASRSSSSDPSSPNKHVFNFEKQKCLSFYFTNYL